eukprot:TRINITY_DN2598_c0_g2_i2.p1 TRINITY_DN2598_c0_g2~~TRINITY_DN2598_c0_g2_i2.p1  ORF type:complete len:394 (+),score=110.54 TRINITY_DN2598_c0_g2_i2:61-1182(+)
MCIRDRNLNDPAQDLDDEVLQKFTEAQNKLKLHQKIVDKYAQKFNISLSEVEPRRGSETRKVLQIINETRNLFNSKADSKDLAKGDSDYYENKVDEVLERVKKRYRIKDTFDPSSKEMQGQGTDAFQKKRRPEVEEVLRKFEAEAIVKTRINTEFQKLQVTNNALNSQIDNNIGVYERERSRDQKEKDKLKSIKDNLKELKRRYKQSLKVEEKPKILVVDTVKEDSNILVVDSAQNEFETPKRKDVEIQTLKKTVEISPVQQEPEPSRLSFDNTAKKFIGEVTPKIEIRSYPNLDRSISYTQSVESSELFRSVERSIQKSQAISADKQAINDEEEIQRVIDSDPVLRKLYTEREAVLQKIENLEEQITRLKNF